MDVIAYIQTTYLKKPMLLSKSDINVKYKLSPKLVSSIQNRYHYQHRFLYIFDFGTKILKYTKIPANISKSAEYASLFENNQLFSIDNIQGKNAKFITRNKVLLDKLILQKYEWNKIIYSWTAFPIKRMKTYTVFTEKFVYLFADDCTCKYDDNFKKVFKLPHIVSADSLDAVACI